jgi:hypothetical protein
VEVQQVKYFLAACEEESFTRGEMMQRRATVAARGRSRLE